MYSLVVLHTCRVECIEFVFVGNHRTGAYRLLPVLLEAYGNGIMRPVHKVSRCAQRPLMTAETAESRMMTLVKQPVDIESAVVIVKTVARKEMSFGSLDKRQPPEQ